MIAKFLPLELGGVDGVLGMQWLYSLGMTEVDWKILSMTFFCQTIDLVASPILCCLSSSSSTSFWKYPLLNCGVLVMVFPRLFHTAHYPYIKVADVWNGDAEAGIYVFVQIVMSLKF